MTPHGRTDATPDPMNETDHRCTATAKSTGERCGRAALPGAKVCRFHGAGAPQVRAAAGRRHAAALAERDAAQAVALWGGRRDIHPAEALLELVQTKASEVAYWRLRVAELQEDDLAWGTTKREFGLGPQGPVDTETREATLAIALDTLHKTEKQLADYAAMSLKAGVDERMVQLAESQANRLLGVIRAVIADQRLGVIADATVVDAVVVDALKEIAA